MSSVFPVRCFTCGKLIGHLENKWNEIYEKQKKLDINDYKKLNITRYCCIRMFMGYVPLEIYPYKTNQK